jgi:hypothetical protein
MTINNYSQDNGGVERYFFKDDFSQNTIGQYILRGTPTIMGGEFIIDTSGEGAYHYISSTNSSGSWEMTAKYTTPYSSGRQYITLQNGVNDNWAINVERMNSANLCDLHLITLSGGAIINVDGGATIADDTWFTVRAEFDGTYWKMFYNGVQKGSTTAGSKPDSSGIGVSTYTVGSAKVKSISYSPSISYSDYATADKTERYQTVSGTAIAFDTNHYNLVANTNSKYRLNSYQFGAGSQIYKIVLPASANDGDYAYVMFDGTADMTKGYGYGVIRTSGWWSAATVLDGSVTNMNAPVVGVADGDTVYIKIENDPSRGVWYGDISETGVWT